MRWQNRNELQPLRPKHAPSSLFVRKRSILLWEKSMLFLAPIAEKYLPVLIWETLFASVCVASTKPGRRHLGRAFKPPPPAKGRPSSQRDHKVSTMVLECANPSAVKPSESGRAESGWRRDESSGGRKKDASDAKRTVNMECTKEKAQKLKHGRLAESVSGSHPAGYD